MSETKKGYVSFDTKNGTVGIKPCPSCGAVARLRETKVKSVCRHWVNDGERLPTWKDDTSAATVFLPHRSCWKIMRYDRDKMRKNDTADLAFVDADWALKTAPTFGCVLHEEKEG